MKKIKCFLSVLALFSATSVLFAQADDVVLRRETFEIRNKFPDSTQYRYYRQMKYYSSAVSNDTTMDTYRFPDQRRTIDFLRSDIYVVLYSAKEIEEKRGTSANSPAIRQEQLYPNVIFEYDSVSRKIIVHNK